MLLLDDWQRIGPIALSNLIAAGLSNLFAFSVFEIEDQIHRVRIVKRE